jgi:hypothetical protein
MVRPRDRKGRFLKSTSKIPGDLFGSTRTPPTNHLKGIKVVLCRKEKVLHQR